MLSCNIAEILRRGEIGHRNVSFCHLIREENGLMSSFGWCNHRRYIQVPFSSGPISFNIWKPALMTVPPNTDVFGKGFDHGEKAGLSKTYWNLKRKMWVPHFSEIIKQP